MTRTTLLLCLAALVFTVAACRDKPPETKCIYGDDIPEETLDPIYKLSENMVQDLTNGDYKKIYDNGTDEMKASQNADQFKLVLELYAQAFGKINFPQIQEAYYLTSNAKTEQVWIPCNLGMQGVNDIYAMPPNKELAVTVYTAKTDLEQMRIVFQLEKAGEDWKLRSINLFPATIKHKLPQYYMEQAIQFRKQNLLHAAFLYYKTAILLSEMGMNVEEANTKVLADQMNQIKVDYMPRGEVQIWSMPSGATYRVYNVDSSYDRGDLLVQVSYMTDSISDHEALRQQALEISAFLDQKFPEYRKGFDGFRITAVPERKEELFTAWHEKVLWADLDQAEKKTPTKDAAPPDAPKEPTPPPQQPAPAPREPAPTPAEPASHGG